MPYLTPRSPARFEQEIQKSRFLGIALPVSTDEGVTAALDEIRREFPDATHHSWASVLGDPGAGHMRSDDDGEPAGTAGRPILNVLRHRGIGDVLVVVVRWFGGVKLGAGGLVRAYSSTASRVVDELELGDATPLVERELVLHYLDEQVARRVLARRRIEIASVRYTGRVVLRIRASEKELDALASELLDRTSGRARLEPPTVGV